jgi:hypothetical protein
MSVNETRALTKSTHRSRAFEYWEMRMFAHKVEKVRRGCKKLHSEGPMFVMLAE